ncbi:MAG TPA: alpha/beta hydrolase [Anaerolineae bacterium]|nr:alpha/beta hydrolase [Anaerolineae bacterium]
MNRLPAILVTLSALLGAVPFVRARTRAEAVLLWPPKLLGGALSPIVGLVGALAAAAGLARRDWTLAVPGLLGAALAARLVADLPDADQALAGLPASGGECAAPSKQGSLVPVPRSGRSGSAEFERNVVIGRKPESGRALRADLWPASTDLPSGLGLIYAHGSGWRVGDKDMGTRPFFRRLAAQGHVVLDIAYSLWPTAGLPAMVVEFNQAILWLKENGPAYGVDPERIVVMGGSAGAHLALLAAYTPGNPAFRPSGAVGDTTVHGVVAFYPPVDLLALDGDIRSGPPPVPGRVDRFALAVLENLFMVGHAGGRQEQVENYLGEMLGGTPAEIPDTYRLLSPIYHAGAHCPPTLLLQGSDDLFGLAPAVRRLHECLRSAGVPSALLEFPHTDHAFDLLLPRVSPATRAATRAVERFLALLT